jgi:hypothetical protein
MTMGLPIGIPPPRFASESSATGRATLDSLLEIGDGVLAGLDLLGVLVRDLDVEGFLQRHHQLHDVKGVGPEIVDERRFGHDLLPADPELLHDQLGDALL